MYCIYCGKKSDSGNFCTGCGRKLVPSGGSGNQNNQLNVSAQQQNHTSSAAVQTPVRQNTVKKGAGEIKRSGAATKKPKNVMVIVLIVILAVAVLAGGAFAVASYITDGELFGFLNVQTSDEDENETLEKDNNSDKETETEKTNTDESEKAEGEKADTNEENKKETNMPAVKPDDSYIAVKDSCTWYNAAAEAAKFGKNTHLVTVDSLDEFDQVCRIAEAGGLKVFWVGMQVKDAYDWYNGANDIIGHEFDFSNVRWYSGEPSGYDNKVEKSMQEFEDCLMFMNVDGVWYANDAPGGTQYTSGNAGYIIEIEE